MYACIYAYMCIYITSCIYIFNIIYTLTQTYTHAHIHTHIHNKKKKRPWILVETGWRDKWKGLKEQKDRGNNIIILESQKTIFIIGFTGRMKHCILYSPFCFLFYFNFVHFWDCSLIPLFLPSRSFLQTLSYTSPRLATNSWSLFY